jgi:hypothetical protein
VIKINLSASASVAVAATIVAEGDNTSVVCASVLIVPTMATLGKEVVVTLSTEEGTGRFVAII